MQITTYENAWPLLADGGVYICEDTSTSMVRAQVTKRRLYTPWVLALVDPTIMMLRAQRCYRHDAMQQASNTLRSTVFAVPYRWAITDALPSSFVSEPDTFAVLCRTL